MGSTDQPRARFVLFPLPAQGHLPPVLNLSKLLAQRGFPVTLVNVDSVHEQLLKLGAFPPLGLDIQLVGLPFEWDIRTGFDMNCTDNLIEFYAALDKVQQELEALMEKLVAQSPPVCCIISDFFLAWTQDVANKFNIPRILFWSGSASWAAVLNYTPVLHSRGDVPQKDDSQILREVTAIPGVPRLQLFEIPTDMRLDNEIWQQRCIKRALLMKEAAWILVDSFQDLEKTAFEAMGQEVGCNFTPIGPLALFDGSSPVSLKPEDTECLEWLDTKPTASVLYISFGSFVSLSDAQFEELALGLEASQQNFLWVIRETLISEEARASKFFDAFCQRTQDRGMIISWAPQMRVLSHPSVAAFLSHCGWNSTVESISAGVPMLCWPLLFDQDLNTKFIVKEWKIGVKVSKASPQQQLVEREEVNRAIKEVMEGQERKAMVERVKTLSHGAWKAVQKEGSSHANLEKFIEEVSHKCIVDL